MTRIVRSRRVATIAGVTTTLLAGRAFQLAPGGGGAAGGLQPGGALDGHHCGQHQRVRLPHQPADRVPTHEIGTHASFALTANHLARRDDGRLRALAVGFLLFCLRHPVAPTIKSPARSGNRRAPAHREGGLAQGATAPGWRAAADTRPGLVSRQSSPCSTTRPRRVAPHRVRCSLGGGGIGTDGGADGTAEASAPEASVARSGAGGRGFCCGPPPACVDGVRWRWRPGRLPSHRHGRQRHRNGPRKRWSRYRSGHRDRWRPRHRLRETGRKGRRRQRRWRGRKLQHHVWRQRRRCGRGLRQRWRPGLRRLPDPAWWGWGRRRRRRRWLPRGRLRLRQRRCRWRWRLRRWRGLRRGILARRRQWGPRRWWWQWPGRQPRSRRLRRRSRRGADWLLRRGSRRRRRWRWRPGGGDLQPPGHPGDELQPAERQRRRRRDRRRPGRRTRRRGLQPRRVGVDRRLGPGRQPRRPGRRCPVQPRLRQGDRPPSGGLHLPLDADHQRRRGDGRGFRQAGDRGRRRDQPRRQHRHPRPGQPSLDPRQAREGARSPSRGRTPRREARRPSAGDSTIISEPPPL